MRGNAGPLGSPNTQVYMKSQEDGAGITRKQRAEEARIARDAAPCEVWRCEVCENFNYVRRPSAERQARERLRLDNAEDVEVQACTWTDAQGHHVCGAKRPKDSPTITLTPAEKEAMTQKLRERSKCRRCGEVGHFNHECDNTPRWPSGKEKSPAHLAPKFWRCEVCENLVPDRKPTCNWADVLVDGSACGDGCGAKRPEDSPTITLTPAERDAVRPEKRRRP